VVPRWQVEPGRRVRPYAGRRIGGGVHTSLHGGPADWTHPDRSTACRC
jgi:hypothetical protein